MATTAIRGSVQLAEPDHADPFVSSTQESQTKRYSLYQNSSSLQTKRALEAHLAETERRLQEASQLGTVLVQQRKDLGERLKDLEKQQSEDEVDPELRKKLVELEHEVNEVGRETARAFLPKSRVPSGESSESSANTSVFSSEASASPSKVSVPLSRRQRNQPGHQIHDMKLTADIVSSLVQQVRELQNVLSERDEAVKSVGLEKSKLEIEIEGLTQRLRALDESEQRYKDENWNLETQVHDFIANSKDASDREKKLSQTLNQSRTEKAGLERELEELKATHAKLTEDHATAKKSHDSELSSFRRNANVSESERGALQRKVDDLTAQNQELAKAVSYRLRAEEQSAGAGAASDREEIDLDRSTPEHSPPPSPSKGTPRHGQLESETLKSSLHHAHRMIQNLKNNIHREKTEKIELRRMLQDARDEIDSRRHDSNGVSSASKKKRNQDVFKKPARPDRLGGPRSGMEEILVDEHDWEDHEGEDTPSKPRKGPLNVPGAFYDSTSAGEGGFETANDNSDAFETANERDGTATESDAFQTGAETLDGDSSDDLTETEGGAAPRRGRIGRNVPAALATAKPGDRSSFLSTASTSGDEMENSETKTPVQSTHPRYRLKINRGGYRKSGRGHDSFSNTPESNKDSPASFMSERSQPAPGQSLFNELGGLEGDSDDESYIDGTPSKSSVLSPESSPEALRRSVIHTPSVAKQTKPEMVDSSTMTELSNEDSKSPGAMGSAASAVGSAIAGAVGFGLGRGSKEEPEAASTPQSDRNAMTTDTATSAFSTPVKSADPVRLGKSTIAGQQFAPVEAKAESAPLMNLSSTMSQHTEPVAPRMNFSSTISQHTEPVVPPTMNFSSTMYQHSETDTMSRPDSLRYSTVSSQHTEPSDQQRLAVPPRYSSASSQSGRPESPIIPRDDPLTIRQESQVAPQPPTLSVSKVSAQSFAPEQSSRPTTAHKNASNAAKAGIGGGIIGSVFGWGKNKAAPEIAEDETSQRAKDEMPREEEDTIVRKDGRQPFKPVAGNRNAGSVAQGDDDALSRTARWVGADDSTQTALSASEIDAMMNSKSTPPLVVATGGRNAPPSPRSPRSASPRKTAYGAEAAALKTPRRPGSASSQKSRPESPPPLPADHKEVIAAATQKTPGTMGPPTMPASAYREQQFRPRTPQNAQIASPTSKGGTTPRARQPSVRNGVGSPISRRSSMSSFASELDQRFNISQMGYPYGHDSGSTDPRMIEAIKQTMIGEFLWKYTRKAGREEMSEKRHRRFFWVHPFTRTLYWSEHDPSTAGAAQLKAKSVAIESVHVVTDDNPMPPGLHRKSIVVVAPGRTVKFTAATAQRHETWFNVLSYLIQRSDGADDAEFTAEDVNEFNPRMPRSGSRQGRSRVSLSSYNSRTTRAASPQDARTSTVTQRQSATGQRASVQGPTPNRSLSNRLSSSITQYFRPNSSAGGSVSSRRSVTGDTSTTLSVYEGDDTQVSSHHHHHHDDPDRLENVRACCDGKHDVGSLPRHRHSSVNRMSRSNRQSTGPSGSTSSRHSVGRPYGPNSHIHHENEMVAAGASAS